MAARKDCLRIATTEDATAHALDAAYLLTQLELLLRALRRRGYIDAEDFGTAIDDVYTVRRIVDGLRADLAQMRRGE